VSKSELSKRAAEVGVGYLVSVKWPLDGNEFHVPAED
jgi:hypothetical protein